LRAATLSLGFPKLGAEHRVSLRFVGHFPSQLNQ
jgi:hypothetical protein